MPAGRPTKYKTEFVNQVYKLCLLGLTDVQMANVLDVTESTFSLWKTKHKEFSESITKGKEIADSNVAESLYRRACGYTHDEEKVFCTDGRITKTDTIKHYPPDTAAAFIWLKNRAGWRDKTETEHSGTVQVNKVERTIVHADNSDSRDILTVN